MLRVDKNTATFEVNNKTYPITQQVYQCVQDYLYNKENINSVSCQPPYIKYKISINDTEKCIKRQLNIILTDSKIGNYVLDNTSIKSI